jgi:CheY-like chemotaxis protein
MVRRIYERNPRQQVMEMSKPIILIVEDNFDNMALLKLLLEREDYHILSARNGEEGLNIVQSKIPDLIVLDLDMPIVNGWEVLVTLKSNPKYQEIPILVVTAHLLSGEHTKVMKAGANGYIAKPFKVSTFISEIKKLV